MDYIEFKVEITNMQITPEIVVAYLSELDFESFVEKEKEIFAYIQNELFDFDQIKGLDFIKQNIDSLKLSFISVKDKNWNEEWESNYDPVLIDGRCLVRAPFHATDEQVQYDIVIEPKMSFGTAHHPTTALMIRLLLDMDTVDKKIMDMGCGTGILAILTALKGCKDITAVDNSDWAFYNTKENIEKNNVKIKAFLGDADLLKDHKGFDIFIANINRNVLLNDIPKYKNSINKEGLLLLSGFFEKDLDSITNKCNESGFDFVEYIEQDEWVGAKFKKSQ